jgi:hypothetical protein
MKHTLIVPDPWLALFIVLFFVYVGYLLARGEK